MVPINACREGEIWVVDVGDVIAYLQNATDKDAETVNQLYDFGKVLLDQIRATREAYHSKLTSCLGWSSAVLALVLIGKDWIGSTGAIRALSVLGAFAAIVSVASSVAGLLSRSHWLWPSEKDWFARDFLQYPYKLRKHHVIVMLESHQSYNRMAQRTGYKLTIAEVSLGAAAVLVGLAAILRQVYE